MKSRCLAAHARRAGRYSPKHEALLTALRDVGFTRLFRANMPAADLWPLPERVQDAAVEFALVGAVATDAMPPLAGLAATTRASLASATSAPPPSDVELFRRSFLPLPEDLGGCCVSCVVRLGLSGGKGGGRHLW